MDEIKVGNVYRHFKGKYVFVENIGMYYDNTPVVIYKGINDGGIFVRPITLFLEEVDLNHEENIAGQHHRFEPVTIK